VPGGTVSAAPDGESGGGAVPATAAAKRSRVRANATLRIVREVIARKPGQVQLAPACHFRSNPSALAAAGGFLTRIKPAPRPRTNTPP